MIEDAGTSTPISRSTWLALVAMGLAVIVIANDFSAVNVALPVMEKDFKTNVNTLQWVINAYALTFGVLIVTGGRLADLFGHREGGMACPDLREFEAQQVVQRRCWRLTAQKRPQRVDPVEPEQR